MENILVNVDSRFRNISRFPNPGNYTYFLKETLKNITSIRLSSIELPNLYYSFAAVYLNTTFTIITNTSTTFPITIEDGNYTAEFMIFYIQKLLDGINTAYNLNFSISWDNINYKVQITNTTPFSLVFSNGSPNLPSLGFYLGFRLPDSNYMAANQLSFVSNNITLYNWIGNTFLNATKDEYIFLRINDYGVIFNDIRDKGLLAKILIFDNQYVIDNGSNFLTKSYRFKKPVNISRLDIELISPLGYTIDMNSIDFSFTLEFNQIYDSNLRELEEQNKNFINDEHNVIIKKNQLY